MYYFNHLTINLLEILEKSKCLSLPAKVRGREPGDGPGSGPGAGAHDAPFYQVKPTVQEKDQEGEGSSTGALHPWCWGSKESPTEGPGGGPKRGLRGQPGNPGKGGYRELGRNLRLLSLKGTGRRNPRLTLTLYFLLTDGRLRVRRLKDVPCAK